MGYYYFLKFYAVKVIASFIAISLTARNHLCATCKITLIYKKYHCTL